LTWLAALLSAALLGLSSLLSSLLCTLLSSLLLRSALLCHLLSALLLGCALLRHSLGPLLLRLRPLLSRLQCALLSSLLLHSALLRYLLSFLLLSGLLGLLPLSPLLGLLFRSLLTLLLQNIWLRLRLRCRYVHRWMTHDRLHRLHGLRRWRRRQDFILQVSWLYLLNWLNRHIGPDLWCDAWRARIRQRRLPRLAGQDMAARQTGRLRRLDRLDRRIQHWCSRMGGLSGDSIR
jgi:hypothetical protein